MIRIVQVSKQFSKDKSHFEALRDITLTIESEEILGIVGESGSGKSTLLRLLALLELPTKGQIIIDDQDVGKLSKKQELQLKKKISLVFQQFNLLSNRTVKQNVQLPLKLAGQKDMRRVEELLDFVGLKDKANVYPRELSGGEKQRVAIARALVTRPNILLCDEPTSALDERNTLEIIQLLKKVHQTYHPTIIFVSHEIDVIQQLCQRVAILEKGNLMGRVNNRPHIGKSIPVSYYEHVMQRLQQ